MIKTNLASNLLKIDHKHGMGFDIEVLFCKKRYQAHSINYIKNVHVLDRKKTQIMQTTKNSCI